MDMDNALGGDCWGFDPLNMLSVNEGLSACGTALRTAAKGPVPSR